MTVLSTDSYLDGVLVLNESLQRCRSRHELRVLVGNEVSTAVRDSLVRAGIQQIDAPPIDIPDEIRHANLASDYHRHWAGVFEKLTVFSLSQFQKIVYIDSDILVLRNLDHLFSHPHMSAVIADRSLSDEPCADLNAGLMVIEPEPGLTSRLLASVPEAFEQEKQWRRAAGRPPSMGVQSVINRFWGDWIRHQELHLEQKYNVLADDADHYIRELGHKWRGPEGVHVLHFVGEVKPWMRTKRNLLRRVAELLAQRKVWSLAALTAYMRALRRARPSVRAGTVA